MIGGGIQIKRPVDFGEHLARARIVGADHDAVGMLEILDRGAFAQEFRIGDDLDLGVGALVAQDSLDLVAGADRHGRFGDDHRGRGKQRRDLAHRLIDEAQIGMAVAAARRRADRDEHGVGFADARGVAGEFEPALAHIGLDQIGEARLEDRDFAAIERGDFGGILVDAGHLMAEIGKAGAGDEPDISGADHGHAHRNPRFRLRPDPARRPARTCLRIHRASPPVPLRARTPHQRQPAPSEQHDHEPPIDQRRRATPATPVPIRCGTWTTTITEP